MRMKIRIITIVFAILLLTPLMLVQVALAGHENPFQFSFYPHEIRFFKAKPDEVTNLIYETTDTPVVKGLHIYLEPLSYEENKQITSSKNIKSLKAIDKIYTILINIPSERTNPLSLYEFRRSILRYLVDREEISKNIAGSEPLFIPITRFHAEYRYVVNIDNEIRSRWKYSENLLRQSINKYLEVSGAVYQDGKITIRNKQVSLSIYSPKNDEIALAISSYIKEKLENIGFKIHTLDYKKEEADILINIYDYQNLTFYNLRNINGIYVGFEQYKGIFLASIIYHNIATQHDELFKASSLSEQEYASLLQNFIKEGIEKSNEQPILLTYSYYVYNDDFDQGIENMVRSPLTGPLTDVFYRTVKLRLFPWNGWLLVGLNTDKQTYYNPILGFDDAWGKHLWMAMSDSAVVFQPYNTSVEPNRVVWVSVETSKGIKVPQDALVIDLSSGRFIEAGEGKQSRAKIVYRVLFSNFHHDEYMSIADILYSYYFLMEWISKTSDSDKKYDPELASIIGDRIKNLVGLKILKVEKKDIVIPGSFNGTRLTPWIEVYLNYSSYEIDSLVSYIPPWTTVPWELLVLMEEVAIEGKVAFSRTKASTDNIPLLDLVKGKSVIVLEKKLEELRMKNYIPKPLRGIVSEEEARKRWDALKKWYDEYGHFLVTNGPYMLTKSTNDMDILTVIRLPTYPLGVGSYDHLSIPRHSLIKKVYVNNNEVSQRELILLENNVNVNISLVVEVEEVRRFARNFTKIWRPSHMAEVMYYITGEHGNLIELGYALKSDEKGIYVIELKNMPSGVYNLNIVSTTRTKYFSQPYVVNYMQPDYFSFQIKIPEGREQQGEVTISMAEERNKAAPKFDIMIIIMYLAILGAISIVLFIIFNRVRHM